MSLPPVYPILDTALLERLGADPIPAAEALLEAGARILQIRHKAFWNRQIFELARQLSFLCREARATFVVNDRADFAALLSAGIHVGQDDLTPEDVRRVVSPDSLLGYSTHNPAQMLAAHNEPIDYVAFGPIFTTSSKDRPDPTVGPEGLKAIRALTTKPLVAIGGITLDNAHCCWDAGADSVAIIGALYPQPCTKQNIRARMTEWLQQSAMLR